MTSADGTFAAGLIDGKDLLEKGQISATVLDEHLISNRLFRSDLGQAPGRLTCLVEAPHSDLGRLMTMSRVVRALLFIQQDGEAERLIEAALSAKLLRPSEVAAARAICNWHSHLPTCELNALPIVVGEGIVRAAFEASKVDHVVSRARLNRAMKVIGDQNPIRLLRQGEAGIPILALKETSRQPSPERQLGILYKWLKGAPTTDAAGFAEACAELGVKAENAAVDLMEYVTNLHS